MASKPSYSGLKNMIYYYVYALKCQQGKWYIGSTKDLEKRYFQHFEGK